MVEVATITTKRQLTIPARLFREAGLAEGQRVVVRKTRNGLSIEPTISIVDKLAGSMQVPSPLRKLSPEQLVARAKQMHFAKHKS